MTHNKSYNAQYYKKHKKKLLDKKKARYADDPQYREAINLRTKLRSNLTRISEGKEVLKIRHCGLTERAYTLPKLAQIVGRDKTALYKWRTDGIIPLGTTIGSREYYSQSQVTFFKGVINKVDKEDFYISYEELKVLFHNIWDKLYTKETLNRSILEVVNGR